MANHQSHETSSVYQTDHPLIEHFLTLMRDRRCPHAQFRNYLKQIYVLLAHETLVPPTFEVPTRQIEVDTPSEVVAEGRIIKSEDMIIVSVMRSGIVPGAAVLELFPRAHLAHIGVQRNDKAGRPPKIYYEKYPLNSDGKPDMARHHCIILEPMISTGDTAIAVLKALEKARGHLQNAVFISLICAPDGLSRVVNKFPELKIVTASVEAGLSETNQILPGMGDASDRAYMSEIMNTEEL
ncbi:MAG: uracil phosphoribosyltransferase [Pseudomonadota bacterium]